MTRRRHLRIQVEHLELDPVGIAEGQDGPVLANDGGRVVDAVRGEMGLPLVQLAWLLNRESEMIDSRARRVEALAAVGVVLLELEFRPDRAGRE